jgi:hypothetical protein
VRAKAAAARRAPAPIEFIVLAIIVEQYQFIAVDHDGAAAIAKLLLNLFRVATGNTGCFFVRVFGETTTQFSACAIDESDYVTAAEVANNLDDANGQQTLALDQRSYRPTVES